MNKTKPTVLKSVSAMKKLSLCKERVRVLTPSDLTLVEGGTSCETWSCGERTCVDNPDG